MTAELHICLTCRAGEETPEGCDRPGARLYAALQAAGAAPGITLRPVRCLSACSNGCAVALTRRGAWAYVYGHMAEADAPEILRGAALYAASADGVVPWRDRPEILRKRSLARIPPLEAPDV